MTKHQAPEVTSELAGCPFCRCELQASSMQAVHPIVDGGCFLEGTGFDASEFPAWNTRATQPLSLTVDEIRIAEREACAMVAEKYGGDYESATSPVCRARRNIAAAIRGRSDRVDDISYAGVGP